MSVRFGFSSGAAPRLAIAVAWGLLAVGVVLFLDREPTRPVTSAGNSAQRTPRGAVAQGEVNLELSAGFRVAQWCVTVGSEEIEPHTADTVTWRGSLKGHESTGRFEVFVEAQSEELFSDHRHAIQIVVQDESRRAERTIWGDGDLNVLVDVEEWLAR